MLPVWILTLDVEERNKLEKLYNDYAKQMRAIAGTVLQTQQDIEDAVSDAFVHIADNMDKLENRDLKDVHAFCVVVAKNAARDVRRKNTRRNTVFTELNDDITAAPLDIIEQYELSEIRKYLLELPEMLQEVLWLYHFMHIPVKNIAGIQKVKPVTVYKRIERGQQSLLKMMKAGDIDAD